MSTKPTTDLHFSEATYRKALECIASLGVPSAAKVMLQCALGVQPATGSRTVSHPTCARDVHWCMHLAHALPEVGARVKECMPAVSPEWHAFIVNWDYLHGILLGELEREHGKLFNPPSSNEKPNLNDAVRSIQASFEYCFAKVDGVRTFIPYNMSALSKLPGGVAKGIIDKAEAAMFKERCSWILREQAGIGIGDDVSITVKYLGRDLFHVSVESDVDCPRCDGDGQHNDGSDCYRCDGSGRVGEGEDIEMIADFDGKVLARETAPADDWLSRKFAELVAAQESFT